MQGGLITTSGDPGQGAHGSLSRFDMHNTLIAAGPDFKAGLVNRLPSANSDVAPTVARILGLTTKTPMDGRILLEAIEGENSPDEAPQIALLQASRNLGEITWKQYLRISRFRERAYYDEGNAGVPKQP
jgi:arylsulfatase A-like enzyme